MPHAAPEGTPGRTRPADGLRLNTVGEGETAERPGRPFRAMVLAMAVSILLIWGVVELVRWLV